MEDKKIRNKLDHVALTDPSVQKINSWFDFISNKKRGVKISRKDFVNWLIERLADTPSNSDVNALIDRFYDEEAFLRQLLRELKQTRRDGQETKLEFIIKMRKGEPKHETLTAVANEDSENAR